MSPAPSRARLRLRGERELPVPPLAVPEGAGRDQSSPAGMAGVAAVRLFVERAVGLLEKVPGLEQVLTIGPVPDELAHVGTDLVATAETFEAKPLEAALLPPDHVVSIAYTGGTTGKPKGVIGTAGAMNTMTQLQLAEWEWPDEPRFLMCTPLSHAGAAFFVPTVIKGGSLYVLARFDPAEVLRRFGWHTMRVHAFELFTDPEGVADRIAELVGADASS